MKEGVLKWTENPLVNAFCLPLLVGHSSGVPPKRKKEIEKNDTTQPAGTVREMPQEISGF